MSRPFLGFRFTRCAILPSHRKTVPRRVFLRVLTRGMALSRSSEPLVWVDCEMTGLDPRTDSILSIACFITDANLNLLDATGFEATIQHTQERLDLMDEWCTKTHRKSGLTKAAIDSEITAEDAANDLLTYIMSYAPTQGTALLAGNSVHADRSFLACPPYEKVLQHLHYRLLDVSAIKEACRRWSPKEILDQCPPKKGLHTAREDILESIEEARWFKRFFERMGLGKGSSEKSSNGVTTRR